MKFSRGDKVKRRVNVFDPDSRIKRGVIIDVYSRPQKKNMVVSP